MEPFALTKEEFIARSMAGEVFFDSEGNKFYYDKTKLNPFIHLDKTGKSTYLIGESNTYFNNIEYLFTLEPPEPRIERRWKYRENRFGITQETNSYYSDEKAKTCLTSSFYKAEDCYIDVEIKD